jgi:MFS family permease
LHSPAFATLLGAIVLGNVGAVMRDVASGWLVTDITPAPAAVATVQAAATLPGFLLAIPAGALSDIIDRRKLLIAVQLYLACVGAALAFLAASRGVVLVNLVLLTFLTGAGAALTGPAWESTVPELVPRAKLKDAIAVEAFGYNIAAAVGPVAGGFVLATFGVAPAYGVNVVGCLTVVVALLLWRRPSRAPDQLSEHFGGAMRAGFRYALASADLRRVLFRTVVFFFFANVAWALLPLVARQVLGGGARFYGLLFGTTGLGAIGGALLLPRLSQLLGAERLVLLASLVLASILASLSLAPPRWAAIVLALVFGAAWITVVTTLIAATQVNLPEWVRGRGLATYIMAISGAVTASSLTWGAIGEIIGVSHALLLGGGCLAAATLYLHRYALPVRELDLTPSNHWPEPRLAGTVQAEQGPVFVTVEYHVDREHRELFLRALASLSEERRRDGAYAWGVSEDAAESGRMLEWFFVESWAEHLRQHRRVSKADADLQDETRRYHTGSAPPKVSHYLAVSMPATPRYPWPPSR